MMMGGGVGMVHMRQEEREGLMSVQGRAVVEQFPTVSLFLEDFQASE